MALLGLAMVRSGLHDLATPRPLYQCIAVGLIVSLRLVVVDTGRLAIRDHFFLLPAATPHPN